VHWIALFECIGEESIPYTNIYDCDLLRNFSIVANQSQCIFCYQVNLLDAANMKSKQLSGGMRRRLSVAIACVGDLDIVILGK